jgi:hypothetical protein
MEKKSDDIASRREVRFHVHPEKIGDLFVTIGCDPHDLKWLGGRPIPRTEGIVRSLRVYADPGM